MRLSVIMNPIGFQTLAVVKICILFGKIVWLNKTRILCLSEKMQDLIKTVRFCNFIQIYSVLNMSALNDKTHSTYLVGIS